MRTLRTVLLTLSCAAAVAASGTPAQADTGVTLRFTSNGGGDAGVPVPGASLGHSVGDPVRFVGNLQGSIGDVRVDPGTCTISFQPTSLDGGAGTLDDCASTSLGLAFDYHADPTAGTFTSTKMYATNGGSQQAVPWGIKCYVVFPPGVIVCEFWIGSAS